MKRLLLLVVAALLLAAGFLSAHLGPANGPADMKRYILGLIYRGEHAESIGGEQLAELQVGHMANIKRLVATGEIVLAGPCEGDGDLRGIFVYDVPTLERAEELVASDPSVAAGRLRVELHAWWGLAALADIRDVVKDESAHEHDGEHGLHEQHGGDDGHDDEHDDDHRHDDGDH